MYANVQPGIDVAVWQRTEPQRREQLLRRVSMRSVVALDSGLQRIACARQVSCFRCCRLRLMREGTRTRNEHYKHFADAGVA
jgi:hypothetical protein